MRGGLRRRKSWPRRRTARPDRKGTRLNSSHLGISYAVFCLKKKKKKQNKEYEHKKKVREAQKQIESLKHITVATLTDHHNLLHTNVGHYSHVVLRDQ